MVYHVDILNRNGEKVKTVDLNPEIFSDDRVNENLIHEFFLLQQSNARYPIAHTKTRAEVSGSGRKLYRQKGTGHARVGDARSPVRKKGGVAFGPRADRNFTKSMNKKMRKLALDGLLTKKAQDSSILGVDSIPLTEPKTKEFKNFLDRAGLGTTKTLVVLDAKNEIIEKSLRNIPKTKFLLADYLNPVDLLAFPKILFLEPALQKINTAKTKK